MHLYCIQFDGQPNYVEAPSFALAIEVWRREIAKENNEAEEDWDDQPESVALVHDGPVWRLNDPGARPIYYCAGGCGYRVPDPDAWSLRGG